MAQFAWDPNDPNIARVLTEVLVAVNQVAQFVSWGEGSPSHTPDGPQLYFEVDGPGVHVFTGSWAAL